jgi:hypothetical protein
MVGRADIEGSKSNVAMNAWLPQASYPYGNFSDTSSWNNSITKGSTGCALTIYINTRYKYKANISPFSQDKVSNLIEFAIRHLCYYITDVPPQLNSPFNYVLC